MESLKLQLMTRNGDLGQSMESVNSMAAVRISDDEDVFDEGDIYDWMEKWEVFEMLERRTSHADEDSIVVLQYWKRRLRKIKERFVSEGSRRTRTVSIVTLRKWAQDLGSGPSENLLPFLNNTDFHQKDQITKKLFRKSLIKYCSNVSAAERSALMETLEDLAYALEFRWWPPKPFLLCMVVLHLAVYLWWVQQDKPRYREWRAQGQVDVPGCSRLLLNPARPHDAWRYVSYSLVHNTANHLAINLTGLVIASVFVEFTNKWWRLLLVFYSGVVFASVALTAVWPTPLVGMSAGVYALVTASLADLALNWSDDSVILKQRRPCDFKETRAIGSKSEVGVFWAEPRPASSCCGFVAYWGKSKRIRYLRLAVTVTWILVDVGQTAYELADICDDSVCATSYMSHLIGGFTGLIVGLFVLKNRKVLVWERVCKNILSIILPIVFIGLLIIIIGRPTTDKNHWKRFYKKCSSEVIFGEGKCCLGCWDDCGIQ